jgi:hypothetical protein
MNKKLQFKSVILLVALLLGGVGYAWANEKTNVKVITDDRRRLLEALFKSYEIVADGTYVYVCDMKYDF